MAHDHNHDHHHTPGVGVNAAFVAGIVFNLIFVFIEAIIGFTIHSLSLLSDAAHNLADVGTLALSLVAFRLLKVKANDQYTYGYRKTSILVALFNSVILLVSIGGIAFEAIHKSFDPQPLPGEIIAWVAGIGIVINGVTALFFFRQRDKDINVKSAYLHLVSDALVSAGIVVGGIVISLSSWYWIDSALSVVIAGIILVSTWKLMKESLRLSLDGVPENISIQEIKTRALKLKGVNDIHHVHVWALSSTENAMTAHLVLDKETSQEQEQKIKHDLRHEFGHLSIQHVTIETERENNKSNDEGCETV